MKKLLSLVALIFSFSPVFCGDFFVEPQLNNSFGQLKEIIYSGFAKEKYASLLEWNFLPVSQAGVSAGYESKYFSGGITALCGIPFECGSMHDSDFIQPAGIKNIFSPFDLNLVQRYTFLVDLKAKVPVQKFSFNFLLEAFYDYSEFLATGGSSFYSSNNWWYLCTVKYYQEGKVNNIGFSCHNFFVFSGIGADVHLIPRLKIFADFFVSPFSFSSWMDNHYWKKNTKIKHSFQGVQYSNFERWKILFGAEYKISERFLFNINCSGIFGDEVKGDLWTDYDDDSFYKSNQKSGSAITQFDFNTGLKILF